MRSDEMGFWARLWLAWTVFWKVLFDALFASRVRQLSLGQGNDGGALPAPAVEQQNIQESANVAKVTGASTSPERDVSAALQLLAILQREGRFIDFLQEEVSGFSDAEIGAAARVVHEGCRRGLRAYLDLAPIRSEPEGTVVVLERGFDAARTRITGAVVGEPPFRGRLAHHGWQVTSIRLPALNDGHDPTVVAPAEVEISEQTG